MIISQSFLDTLSAQAKANSRLRQAYDLRNSENDNSQRMLNALEMGTVVLEAMEGRYEAVREGNVRVME